MNIKQIVIGLFASSLLGCAGSSGTSEEGNDAGRGGRADCISRASIRGYSVLDETNVLVEASGRRNYHMVLRYPARGLRSTLGIGFETTTGRICAPFDSVAFRGDMGHESIPIRSIRELSVEEYETLLIRYGKKEPEIEHTPTPREVKGAEVEELDTAADGD